MNISNYFDHSEMPEDRKQYIGFEWQKKFAGTTFWGIHSAPFEVTKSAFKNGNHLVLKL
jgi:hypothetical protein